MDDEIEGLSVIFQADMGDISSTPGQFEDVFGAVEDAASSASDAISSSMSESVDEIGSFDEAVQFIRDTMGDAQAKAFALASGLDDLGMAGEETGTKITEGLSSSGGGFSDLEDAIASVKAFVSDAADEIDSRLSSIGDTAEESASQSEDAFSGFNPMKMVNGIGMTIMNLQMMGQVAGQTASALLGPAETAETTKTAFDNLLGSSQAAADELGKLNSFAAKTQFPTQTIDDAASSMIAFKIPTETIIPDLTAVGDALSGVGKGTPAELQSVVDILGKMSIAGKLTQGDITELGKHGIDATSAIADGLGISTTALQDMVKKGTLPASDAIAALTKGIEDNPLYNGGMAKQSGTMSGLLSTLQSNWNQVLAAFGSPIIAGLDPLLANIGNDLASPGFHDFAGNVGQGIVDAFSGIGHAAQYVDGILQTVHIQDFKEAWQSFTAILGDIEQHLFGAGSAFKELGTDADPIAGIIGNLAQGGLNILSNLLWGIDSALMDVDKAFSGVASPVTQAGDSLKQFIGPAENIANMLEGQFSDAFHFATTEVQQIATWAEKSGILQDLGQDFMNVGHVVLDLGQIFVNARGQIQSFIENTFEKFGPILGQIIPPVMQFATTIGTDATEAFTKITPDIMAAENAIGQFADGVINRVEPIVEHWLPYLEEEAKDLKQGWDEVFPYLKEIVVTTFDDIKDVVETVWPIVSGIINVGLDLLDNNWGQAWQDMESSIKGSLQGIEDSLKPALEGMTQIPGPAGDMANSVLQAFGDASDGSQQKMLEMKSNNEQIAIESAAEIVKHYDDMRQKILQELSQTTDDAKKQTLETQLGEVTNAENAAKQVVQKHVEMHQQTVSQLDQFKKDATDKFSAIKDGVEKSVSDVTGWVQDEWKDATQFIVDKFDWLYNHNYYFKDMVDAIKKDVTEGKAWLETEWDSVRADMVNKWDEIKTDVSEKATELWNDVKGVFEGAWNNAMHNPVVEAGNNLQNTINGWANDAIGWGEHLISGFITGMENQFGNLNNAADQAMQDVAKFLGFHSPSEEGPGTELMEWGPNMIKGFSEGMVSAIPQLQASLNAVMTPVASTLSTPPASTGLANFVPQMPTQGAANGTIQLNLTIQIGDQQIAGSLVTPIMNQVVKTLRLQGGKMLSV